MSRTIGIVHLVRLIEFLLTDARDDDHATDDEEGEPEFSDECCVLTCFFEPALNKVPRHSTSAAERDLIIAIANWPLLIILLLPRSA